MPTCRISPPTNHKIQSCDRGRASPDNCLVVHRWSRCQKEHWRAKDRPGCEKSEPPGSSCWCINDKSASPFKKSCRCHSKHTSSNRHAQNRESTIKERRPPSERSSNQGWADAEIDLNFSVDHNPFDSSDVCGDIHVPTHHRSGLRVIEVSRVRTLVEHLPWLAPCCEE